MAIRRAAPPDSRYGRRSPATKGRARQPDDLHRQAAARPPRVRQTMDNPHDDRHSGPARLRRHEADTRVPRRSDSSRSLGSPAAHPPPSTLEGSRTTCSGSPSANASSGPAAPPPPGQQSPRGTAARQVFPSRCGAVAAVTANCRAGQERSGHPAAPHRQDDAVTGTVIRPVHPQPGLLEVLDRGVRFPRPGCREVTGFPWWPGRGTGHADGSAGRHRERRSARRRPPLRLTGTQLL
jgi:hypothetical protein